MSPVDDKAIRGECQSLINHFEDNPEDVTLMVGQKDGSKAVSTEALMTVFHPQDVENLDPKMVKTFFSLYPIKDALLRLDLHAVGCWCFIHVLSAHVQPGRAVIMGVVLLLSVGSGCVLTGKETKELLHHSYIKLANVCSFTTINDI